MMDLINNQSTNDNFCHTDDGPAFAHNNINSQNSEETPLDVGKSANSMGHHEAEAYLPIEKEIAQITYRF
jgi:hypothetical protein